MGTAIVNAAALADWRRALGRLDLDTTMPELLHQGACSIELLQPNRSVSLAGFVSLIERVVNTLQKPSLSWRIGQSADYAGRGKIGAAVLGAKTLGVGLRRLCDFYPLLQDSTSLRLEIGTTWSSLGYKILDPTIWPRHEDAMYSLGLYAKLIKAAAPDVWSQAEIMVEAERSFVKCDVGDIVGTTVTYGGPANILRFPTCILDSRLCLAPAPSPASITGLSRDLTRKRRATALPDRARYQILHEMNFGCTRQDQIARELGLSSRALRRNLAKQNVSFKALLDECRFQFAALEFRTRHNLSLSEMAWRLGYSEHSTFSRAFSRWSGMPPQDYRRSLSAH